MQQQLDNLFGALTQGTGPQVTPLAFLLLMTVSLLSSMFIAYLYVHFYSNRATGSQVHRAFPLLGISITAIFVTIQFSLPLSLGLLGRVVDRPVQDADQGARGDRFHHAGDLPRRLPWRHSSSSFVGIIFVVALAALFGQALTRRFTGAESDGTIVISLPGERQARRSRGHHRTCCASGFRKPSSRASRKRIARPSCPTTSRGFPTPR